MTFTAQPDSSLANNGGTNVFNNNASGTFTRNTGTGNCDVNIPFNNAGTVNASSGTLRFQAGFTQTAGLTTLNGGNVSSKLGAEHPGRDVEGIGHDHRQRLQRRDRRAGAVARDSQRSSATTPRQPPERSPSS